MQKIIPPTGKCIKSETRFCFVALSGTCNLLANRKNTKKCDFHNLKVKFTVSYLAFTKIRDEIYHCVNLSASNHNLFYDFHWTVKIIPKLTVLSVPSHNICFWLDLKFNLIWLRIFLFNRVKWKCTPILKIEIQKNRINRK